MVRLAFELDLRTVELETKTRGFFFLDCDNRSVQFTDVEEGEEAMIVETDSGKEREGDRKEIQKSVSKNKVREKR